MTAVAPRPVILMLVTDLDVLLRRVARQDADAFAAFYDAYAERILLFLVRRVLDVDTAFDLLSETFATALERRHQFRGWRQGRPGQRTIAGDGGRHPRRAGRGRRRGCWLWGYWRPRWWWSSTTTWTRRRHR